MKASLCGAMLSPIRSCHSLAHAHAHSHAQDRAIDHLLAARNVLIQGTPDGGPAFEETPTEALDTVEEQKELAKLNRRLAWAYAGERGELIGAAGKRDVAVLFLKEALQHGDPGQGLCPVACLGHFGLLWGCLFCICICLFFVTMMVMMCVRVCA
jgi:hypothetical protein